jgi:hypothetical protein
MQARVGSLALWLAILALYLALRVPLLDVPLERDEGAFALVGQAILRGEVPYRDVLDHKPPGVYYLYAAALALVPHTARGVHLALLVWNLATLACAAALAGRLAGGAAARWAALVFALASSALAVQGFSATTEMLLLLPLTASLLLTVRGLERRDRQRSVLLAAAGALGAAACWIKQPAAAALLPVPIAILANSIPRNGGGPGRGSRLVDGAAWLAGALALSAATAAAFAAAGALSELWYWTVTHNRIYVTTPADWPQRLARALGPIAWELGAPIALGVVGCIGALLQRRPRAWLPLAFLCASALAAAHSPFFYAHYFALLAPATALAAGCGLAWLQERARRIAGAAGAYGFASLALAALLAPPLVHAPWYWLRPDPSAVALKKWGGQGFDGAAAVAAYLRAFTDNGERLFIYGSEPQIAFLSGRRDASPFATVYPLTGAFPRQREFQERAWAAIGAAPPRYILVARLPPSLMRAAAMDPFLETRLADLLRRAYGREAFMVYEPSGSRLALPGDPALSAGALVQLELWRRRD